MITQDSSPIASNVNSTTNELTIPTGATGNIIVGADWTSSDTAGVYPEVTCSEAPIRTGYTFKGWYTAETTGNQRCGAGGKYRPAESEDLYAQRTAVDYNIAVDTTGGNEIEGQTYQISGVEQRKTFAEPTYNTTYTVSYDTERGSENPASQTSTKPFSGWTVKTQPSGGAATFTDSTLNIPENVYGDMEILANW
jgi:hypothetical protein